MPNANYTRGRAAEYRAKAKLELDGWTVWRTPGSKSPADLIAIRGEEFADGPFDTVRAKVRLVQVKSGRASMTRAARATFLAFAEDRGCEAWLALPGLKFERVMAA